MEIKMIKEDVAVEPLVDDECDKASDDCTGNATHRVTIDLRAIGTMGVHVGVYCETCATEIATRIRASLPENDGTQ